MADVIVNNKDLLSINDNCEEFIDDLEKENSDEVYDEYNYSDYEVDSMDELGLSIGPEIDDIEKNEIDGIYEWFSDSNIRFIYIDNGKCIYEYIEKGLKISVEKIRTNSTTRLYKIVDIEGEMSYKNLFIRLVNKFLGLVNDPEKLMLKLDYYVSTVINETSVIVQAAGIITQPDKDINRETIIKEMASMLLELMHPTNYLISIGAVLNNMLWNLHKHCFICGLFHKKDPLPGFIMLCDSHICAMENDYYIREPPMANELVSDVMKTREEFCKLVEISVTNAIPIAQSREILDPLPHRYTSIHDKAKRFVLLAKDFKDNPSGLTWWYLCTIKQIYVDIVDPNMLSKLTEKYKLPPNTKIIKNTNAPSEIFRNLCKQYGKIYGYHGSISYNWISILRNGLVPLSNTKYMTAGQVHGPGIYFGKDYATSLGYAYTKPSIIGICKLVSNNIEKAGWCYVINNVDYIYMKYLTIVY